MAGGKITRVALGDSTTEVEGNFEGFYQNLAFGAGTNIYQASITDHKNPENEPKAGKFFVKGWWTNHKDEPIKRAIYGQVLRFHIEMDTEHTKPEDKVYFALFDCDSRPFGNDVVKADDPINLEYKDGSGRAYVYEKVNSEHKVVIEFSTADNLEQWTRELDQDRIFELYFKCTYANHGNTELVDLPYNFSDYLALGAIVIDRYKMPGLNPEGTGIAEDMAYGTGYPYMSKEIYSEAAIAQYKEDYVAFGFDKSLHTDFANIQESIKHIELEEVAIPAPEKGNKSVEEDKTWMGSAFSDAFDEAVRIQKQKNQKAIYSKEELYNIKFDWIENFPLIGRTTVKENYRIGEDIKSFNEGRSPLGGGWKDDSYLFWNFKNTARFWFARGELEENLNRMIDKFMKNEGGVYEDEVLTRHIIEHPNTIEYCEKVEDYIAEQLKKNFSKLEEVEDKEPYFSTNKIDENGRLIFANKNNLRKDIEKSNFSKPSFSYGKSLLEAAKGLTIALNDIWAAEVVLKAVRLNEEDYTAKYEVTLWDHFGLDKPDLEKRFAAYPSIKESFICWFVLQHLRNYKPFVTKITFIKEFIGNLQKGKLERVQQRIEEKNARDEELRNEQFKQLGRKKIGEY